MATPYELAFISNYVYGTEKQQETMEGRSAQQQTRIFKIGGKNSESVQSRHKPSMVQRAGHSSPRVTRSSAPARGREDWAIIDDIGISDSLYLAKFQNLGTGEIVFAFRGTRATSMKDWLKANSHHMSGRTSPYITKALAFLKKDNVSNAYITGHSLGGFMAVTMAFHFQHLKIVAFNPPQVTNSKGAILEAVNAAFVSNNFKTCKILIYESLFDGVSIVTKLMRRSNPATLAVDAVTSLFMGNVKYEKIPDGGFHSIKASLKYLKKNGRNPVNFN